MHLSGSLTAPLGSRCAAAPAGCGQRRVTAAAGRAIRDPISSFALTFQLTIPSAYPSCAHNPYCIHLFPLICQPSFQTSEDSCTMSFVCVKHHSSGLLHARQGTAASGTQGGSSGLGTAAAVGSAATRGAAMPCLVARLSTAASSALLFSATQPPPARAWRRPNSASAQLACKHC